MKIQTLTISDFRCFKHYHLEFTPGTTIVIGRNGAGKSTLIDALKIALSFIFASNKELGDDFLSAGNPSLSINSFDEHDFRMDEETRTIAPDAGIKAKASYNGTSLEWEIYKRSTANAALYSSKYKEAFRTFTHQWNARNADLPLLAYISDSFPHKNIKETKYAIETVSKPTMPRNFGYYQWDLSSACTSIWELRLCNKLSVYIQYKVKQMELVATGHKLRDNEPQYHEVKEALRQLNERYSDLEEEVLFVTNRLKTFSEKLPSLQDEGYVISNFSPVALKDGYALNLIFDNGKECLLKNLPAGYCRLYSIVLDLAYREYILNGNKESQGIVMIDEIDLHLHPSLEQEVVGCLQNVFPLVQFILTTHSAAVIANLDTTEKVEDEETRDLTPANQLVFMQEGQTEGEVLPIIYGVDYNAALRDFMGSPSRNEDLRKKGDEYLNYCSMGLEQEARTIIGELTQSLGTEHPFVKELQDKAKAYEVH